MCIVRVSAHYPGLANLVLEPFGVAYGESAAACRYFMQALIEDDPGRRDMPMEMGVVPIHYRRGKCQPFDTGAV